MGFFLVLQIETLSDENKVAMEKNVAYELHKPSKRKAHSKTPQTVNPVYDYVQ